MDDFRPSFRAAGGNRRLEIVSGKGFGSQQMYSTGKPRSPDTVGAPPRQNKVASSSSSSKTWGFSDPEMKRKKRIVRYKVYSIEGKFKASIKNGFRWIKNKCSELIHGY